MVTEACCKSNLRRVRGVGEGKPIKRDVERMQPQEHIGQGLASDALANPARRMTMLCVAAIAVMAVAIHILPLLELAAGLMSGGYPGTVINRDFSNYWMAGQLLRVGEQQDLFNQSVYFARAQATFGTDYEIHNWGYPPHFLLLLWPLGWVGYKAGMLLFLGITLALFTAGVAAFRRRFAPDAEQPILLLALVGYVLMQVLTTQNGFLTSAALLFGLAWMRDRPLLAGLAFAFLTVKPQLGMLIPLLLFLDRNWRVIAAAALFTALLIGISAVCFGLISWQAYLTETITYQRSVMTDWYGLFLRMMPTVFGSMRTLDFTPHAAALTQWPASLGAGALIIWTLIKIRDSLQRAFVILCGTFVVSPYAFNYDMGAVTVAAALIVGSRAQLGRYAQLAVAVVAALAGIVTHLGRAGIPISPLLLGAALLAIAVQPTGANTAAASGAAPVKK